MKTSELKFSIPHLAVARILALWNPPTPTGWCLPAGLGGLGASIWVGPMAVVCGPNTQKAGAGLGGGLLAPELGQPPLPARPAPGPTGWLQPARGGQPRPGAHQPLGGSGMLSLWAEGPLLEPRTDSRWPEHFCLPGLAHGACTSSRVLPLAWSAGRQSV